VLTALLSDATLTRQEMRLRGANEATKDAAAPLANSGACHQRRTDQQFLSTAFTHMQRPPGCGAGSRSMGPGGASLLAFCAALAVLDAERSNPDANISDFATRSGGRSPR
jgi:hypothetical protein